MCLFFLSMLETTMGKFKDISVSGFGETFSHPWLSCMGHVQENEQLKKAKGGKITDTWDAVWQKPMWGMRKLFLHKLSWLLLIAHPKIRQIFIFFLSPPIFLVLMAWLYVFCTGFGFFSLLTLYQLHISYGSSCYLVHGDLLIQRRRQ